MQSFWSPQLQRSKLAQDQAPGDISLSGVMWQNNPWGCIFMEMPRCMKYRNVELIPGILRSRCVDTVTAVAVFVEEFPRDFSSKRDGALQC